MLKDIDLLVKPESRFLRQLGSVFAINVVSIRWRNVKQPIADLHIRVTDFGGQVGRQVSHDPVAKLWIGLTQHQEFIAWDHQHPRILL